MGSSRKNDRKSSKKSAGMPRSPTAKKSVSWDGFSQDHFSDAAQSGSQKAKKRRRYDQIGRELRQMFKDVVNEPIPSDLLDLVDKLEEQSDGEPEEEN